MLTSTGAIGAVLMNSLEELHSRLNVDMIAEALCLGAA